MPATTTTSILRFQEQQAERKEDVLAVEEPLEIQLTFGPAPQRQTKSISITMRTPGQDEELATGFLYTEGIIHSSQAVESTVIGPTWLPEAERNQLCLSLTETTVVDLKRIERHFYTSSSCGVCGKTSIEAVQTIEHPLIPAGSPQLRMPTICQLPEKLRKAQAIFDRTGGLHAAALFDAQGELLIIREDVGRHNAVDKVIGAALNQGLLPASELILQVSGRISFELVQKALMAGIPIMAAVGAPSSLAVDLARSAGMTLAGFVRAGGGNVYCGEERILQDESGIKN